jgi:glycosyltransferase involved in cell wall biosynthesis
MRILHVFSGLNHGGAETWFMHMLRRLDPAQFKIDVLVRSTQPGAYADEVNELGGRVVSCFVHRRFWQYERDFRQIVARYGPYDAVHSHIRHFSGYVLCLARRAGISARIVHVHSDNTSEYATANAARRLYLNLSRRWIKQCATAGLFTSRQAAAGMFGPAWEQDPRWRVLYCGIDLEPFAASVDRAAVRAELGLPPDALVLGHVGRFVEEKNHTFLIDIMGELTRREPRAHLLLVGDGPLLPKIQAQAAAAGLAERVTFVGARSDVARLMRGAMDGCVFPSLREGLGLVLVEAQAAGLPSLCSDVIPDEAIVTGALVWRKALHQPPAAWAEALLAQQAQPRLDSAATLAQVRQSPFAVEQSLDALVRCYNTCRPG